MCGRISQHRGREALASIYREAPIAKDTVLLAGDELGPGQPIAVVHGSTPTPTLAATCWGLTTSWTRPGRPLLHARAESATAKPTFRDAARTHRAIVPCEGWTEWCATGGPRDRYWARQHGANSPVHIAALTFLTPNAVTSKCVLVTTAAAPSMAAIHHCQALCLEGDEIDAWLNPMSPLADIEAILAAGSKREPGLTLERVGRDRTAEHEATSQ